LQLDSAWLAEHGFGVASSLVTGTEVNFPEDTETVQENIREIGAQSSLGPKKLGKCKSPDTCEDG
jgi:long-chain acyl-CoA synthetase